MRIRWPPGLALQFIQAGFARINASSTAFSSTTVSSTDTPRPPLPSQTSVSHPTVYSIRPHTQHLSAGANPAAPTVRLHATARLGDADVDHPIHVDKTVFDIGRTIAHHFWTSASSAIFGAASSGTSVARHAGSSPPSASSSSAGRAVAMGSFATGLRGTLPALAARSANLLEAIKGNDAEALTRLLSESTHQANMS